MPLFNRVLFRPNEVPKDLDLQQKVYYCDLTGEIFNDYEEYFDRRIQLDTEVWSCQLTGRTNLTFEEAVDSETSVKKQLKKIDKRLTRAVLYLLHKASGRTSFAKLAHELFLAVKDKLFIGEKIVYQKKKYKVVSAKCPEAIPNGRIPNGEINGKRDSDEENKTPNEKVPKTNNCDMSAVYELEHMNDTGDITKKTVKASEINFNKARSMTFSSIQLNRLLKLHSICRAYDKAWELSKPSAKKFKISDDCWPQMWSGPEPYFEKLTPRPIKPKPEKRKSNEKVLKEKQGGKVESEMRKKAEEDKRKNEEERKKREKQLQMQRRNEAAEKLMAAERIWRRVRSDETLDDLSEKILPAPEEVPTSLSPDLVGDCLALVEFQKVFGSEKSFGSFMHSDSLKNLTLSDIEGLLQEQTTSGLFCDILFFYIQAFRFCLSNEIEESGCTCNPLADLESNDIDPNQNWPTPDGYDAEAICDQSTTAAHWSVKTLGRLVTDLQVDEITVTEVLRLIMLSSGSRMDPSINSYRNNYRGGWSVEEDTMVQALSEKKTVELLKKMETESVFSFGQRERLQLLLLLTHAVLSFPDGREVLDDAEEEIKEMRKKLNELQREEWKRKSQLKSEIGEIMKNQKELQEKLKESGSTRSDEAAAAAMNDKIEKLQTNGKIDEESFEDESDKLSTKILKTSLKYRSVLLGTDRFHRRYYLMSRSSGILVEVPASLPPVVQPDNTEAKVPQENGSEKISKEVNPDPKWKDYKLPAFVKRPQLKDFLLPEDEPTSHSSKTQRLTPPPTINGGVIEDEEMEVDEDQEKLALDKQWSFTPNINGAEWFQYTKQEDIRKLYDGLNTRGIREKVLRENIEKYFNCFPRGQSLGFGGNNAAKGKRQDTVFDVLPSTKDILSCRDYILDIEERIFNADFGDSFNDEQEREKWREFWQFRDQRHDLDFAKMLDPERTHLKKLKKHDSIPESVKFTIHLSENGQVADDGRERLEEVRNLAASVVVLARGLVGKTSSFEDNNVLTRPLFSSHRNEGKKKEKQGWRAKLNAQFNNWQSSILTCTSGSALYLHIIHLDECISWQKSPENLRCKVCRKKSDGANMLICDDCEKAFHTYCHKPRVRSIPEGDWFCKECKAKQALESSPRKARRRTTNYKDDSDESEDEDLTQRSRKRRKVDYRE